MVRSRNGPTTKIHAVVDTGCLTITLKLTVGQPHDGRRGKDMLETIQEDDVLLADRAYTSDALRAEMTIRGAWANNAR